jgi:ribosome-associated translation inhibitor RaiA
MSQLSSSPNSYLQLCVNDLLHPTEKSESLLEALTSKQLEEIEKTLNKIKEKKQSSPKQLGKYMLKINRLPIF